jgi:hypothetical protein
VGWHHLHQRINSSMGATTAVHAQQCMRQSRYVLTKAGCSYTGQGMLAQHQVFD